MYGRRPHLLLLGAMRKNTRQKRSATLKISVCGVLAALSYCLLALGSIVEILDFSAVVIASFSIVFCVAEMGYSYAFLTYGVTSLISVLLLPGSRFAALVYICFGGVYPILKSFIERNRNKLIQILLKVLYVNAAALGIWFISSWLIPDNEYLDKIILIAFVGLINFAFWLYDVLITRVVTMYMFKWRKQLNIKGFDK